jgi:hypothetical protein
LVQVTPGCWTVRLAGKVQRTSACITLVNASDAFVERLRPHELAAGKVMRPRPMWTLAGTGVQFVQGRVAHRPGRSEITVQTPAGTTQQSTMTNCW